MAWKYFLPICSLPFIFLPGLSQSKSFTFWCDPVYHFFFFRMCFWCQSKSTSPSPRFQRFVLCLFSKSFSFTFYISVQGPLWVNYVRSVWVWGLARGSAPFVEMETFSPLNGPCILVRSQILFPGSLLCCTDLSVYPSPKATMAQTSYRVALTLGKLFSSFSKLPKLFWVLCLSL